MNFNPLSPCGERQQKWLKSTKEKHSESGIWYKYRHCSYFKLAAIASFSTISSIILGAGPHGFSC